MDEITDATAILRKLIHESKKAGAVTFEVWGGDEEPDYKGEVEQDIVQNLLACDMTALVAVDEDGTRWGRWQIIPSNGEDVISDYHCDKAGRADAVFNASVPN